MPTKKIKKGDSILVSLEIAFEGTIRSYAVFLEKQFIPTVDNKAKDHPIIVDGDPFQLHVVIAGVKGAVLKKLEITINGVVGISYKDIKFKGEQLTIDFPFSYSLFNLEEDKSNGHQTLNPTV
jgi:hypothetical protein